MSEASPKSVHTWIVFLLSCQRSKVSNALSFSSKKVTGTGAEKTNQEVRDGNRTRLAGSRVQRLRPLSHGGKAMVDQKLIAFRFVETLILRRRSTMRYYRSVLERVVHWELKLVRLFSKSKQRGFPSTTISVFHPFGRQIFDQEAGPADSDVWLAQLILCEAFP